MDDKSTPCDDAFETISYEYRDTSSYQLYPEHDYGKIQSVLTPEKNTFDLYVQAFKDEFQIDKILPGQWISFYQDPNIPASWSHDPLYNELPFRVRSLTFTAEKLNEISEVEFKVLPFKLKVQAILEDADEKHIPRPQYTKPKFPFYIEGKIHCLIGEEEQTTFDVKEGELTPEGNYFVTVPLAKDKKVIVPFAPDFMTGQHYYPLCKNQKVLLRMHFTTARIYRVLDWQPLARLPYGTQGNQLVLSSNGTDKYVILKHEFVDGKNSVFTIEQSSSKEQKQTIKIQEEDLLIQVDTKGKKTIKANFNKKSGLLLSLTDNDSNAVQTTSFDGTAMTHTCSDGSNTSTITQKGDSVTIDCETFNVNSKNINLDAKDAIIESGASQIALKSQVVKADAPSVILGG